MMTPKKKPEVVTPEQEFGTVRYLECQTCGSLDYDEVRGDLNSENMMAPVSCDCCCFGDIKKSGIPIH